MNKDTAPMANKQLFFCHGLFAFHEWKLVINRVINHSLFTLFQDFRVTLENPRSAWTAPGAPGDSPARWVPLEAWDRQECLGSARHVTAASTHQ